MSASNVPGAPPESLRVGQTARPILNLERYSRLTRHVCFAATAEAPAAAVTVAPTEPHISSFRCRHSAIPPHTPLALPTDTVALMAPWLPPPLATDTAHLPLWPQFMPLWLQPAQPLCHTAALATTCTTPVAWLRICAQRRHTLNPGEKPTPSARKSLDVVWSPFARHR